MSKYNGDTEVKCPECGTVSDIYTWNEITEEIFGNILPLEKTINKDELIESEDYWYVCPACTENIDSDLLEVVEEE